MSSVTVYYYNGRFMVRQKRQDGAAFVAYSDYAALERECADRALVQADLAHQLNVFEHERVAPLVCRAERAEARVKELEADYATMRDAYHETQRRILKADADAAEYCELLTIAHMDGYSRGSQGLNALVINNTILRERVVELKDENARLVESLRELKMSWGSDVSQLDAAEATLRRIMDDVRGKCWSCRYEPGECRECDPCGIGDVDNWTPRKEWGVTKYMK